MTLKDRETDPVTYMYEGSFRLYELDRGVSFAIYGMIPERQLPLNPMLDILCLKMVTLRYTVGDGYLAGDPI